ncbi:choice-of-anchor Q domain-containing protein [Marinicella meishanensis]|uniref:choice-of-anchor Q domain-containing protein n=1 Tax=Marinicella meishanensis TaxID=2873263 RepID=UPI001CBF2DDD|nr:choice-of-anchor Q domain-containing protein [Marinicella sp. NBU2979]
MKKILCCVLLAIHGLVSAAIFQVDLTVQDQVDGDPGDGVCEIPTGGFCTLRAAVMEANALAGPDIIVLPGDRTIQLTIDGDNENAAASGDLDITESVAIGAFTEDTENYPTVDATQLDDRVFHVLSGVGVVTLVNFRVTNGSADFNSGGGINISIDNQVELNRMWFEDNTADSGGAIYLNGLSELNIIDSVFKGNAAVSQGGAMSLFGLVDIDRATIYENLNLNDGFQEAVFVGFSPFGSTGLTIRNATIFDNSNTGIFASGADLSIRNTTVVNHSNRGVVSNPNDFATPELRIRNSLFDQNNLNCANGLVDLQANNWNISSDNSSCFAVGSTNLNEQDPKLTVLKTDDENWHRYFRLGFFSPAVDSAHPAAPGPGIGCEGVDQRGVSRPQDSYADGDARCDRGAIELSADIIFYDDLDISYIEQQ